MTAVASTNSSSARISSTALSAISVLSPPPRSSRVLNPIASPAATIAIGAVTCHRERA
ncbi:MAG TPA: hypothetical protein VFG15_11675 [Amycolatopsis sp.]|nr:hypothetical protein [Amycolatopsis sp.]